MTKILKTTILTLTAVIFSACPSFYSRAQGASAFSANLKNTKWESSVPVGEARTTTVVTETKTGNETETTNSTILSVRKATLVFTNDSFTLTQNEFFNAIDGMEFLPSNSTDANAGTTTNVKTVFSNFFGLPNTGVKLAKVPNNEPTGREAEMILSANFSMSRNNAAEYIYTISNTILQETRMENESEFEQSGETFTFKEASGKKNISIINSPGEIYLVPVAALPSDDGQYKISTSGNTETLTIFLNGDRWEFKKVK